MTLLLFQVPSIGVTLQTVGEIAQNLNFKYLCNSHSKSNELLWAFEGYPTTPIYSNKQFLNKQYSKL
jgi:hypothetical protein